jgi:heme oxygenase
MNNIQLAQRLRTATHGQHRVAEQSGVMQRLLRGQIGQQDYALLLRNLHALYASLEQALERNSSLPMVGPVRMPVLYRTAALADDLRHYHGEAWETLPLTKAITAYVARIEEVSEAEPQFLSAHAYVRYLGDLSGGQMLGQIVRDSLSPPDNVGTAFYAFGSAVEVEALKQRFRTALDELPLDSTVTEAVVREAKAAFDRHIALFTELDRPA